VQALLISLEGIRARLEALNKNFRWFGGDSGDTGFPWAIPTFFGSEFSRKLDLILKRKCATLRAQLESENGDQLLSDER